MRKKIEKEKRSEEGCSLRINQESLFIFWEVFHSQKSKEKCIDDWEMAKKYAEIIKDPKHHRVYKRFRYMIDSFVKLGYFDKKLNGEGKEVFFMNANSITLKKHKFPRDGLQMSLVLRI